MILRPITKKCNQLTYIIYHHYIRNHVAKLHHQFIESSINTPYNIIALHGLLGSSNNFRSLLSNYSIKSKANSYILDLRNHGGSEHKPTMEIHEMADDVVNFIKEKNLKNLIILGHSLGGKVLLSLATAFPEIYQFIKGIIIIDIAPVNYFKDITRKYKAIGDNLLVLKHLNGINLKNRDYNELRKEIIYNCQTKEIGELVWTNVLHEKENNHRWRINLPSIIEYYNKILEFVPNSENVYQGKIQIIRGGKSEYILEEHFKNFTDIFKNLNKNTDIITIKDASHFVHFEKPYEVIKILSETIENVRTNDNK